MMDGENIIQTYPPSTNGLFHVRQQEFFLQNVAETGYSYHNTVFASECTNGKSSSWEVIIRISKDAPFSNFKISAELNRKDSGQDPLDGNLSVWLVNTERKLCKIPYRLKREMKGGETASHSFDVNQHYKCLTENEDGVTFPKDALIIKITLLVSGCHKNEVDRDGG